MTGILNADQVCGQCLLLERLVALCSLSWGLAKYLLLFINALWPLNCSKVSANQCSWSRKAPQRIRRSAGVCQTASPQKTQQNGNIPARWAAGSATQRSAGGFRLRPCGQPQPRGPRVLGVLAASLVSFLTSRPRRAENHLLSLSGAGGRDGVPLGGGGRGGGGLSLHLSDVYWVKSGVCYSFTSRHSLICFGFVFFLPVDSYQYNEGLDLSCCFA